MAGKGSTTIKPGSILLAEPFLKEPPFARAAILLCHLDEEGALGLVLNKPIDNPFQTKPEHPFFKAGLFSGGPVDSDHLFYLHQNEKVPGAIHLKEGMYWQGDFQSVKDFVDQNGSSRFFLGYSGWESGQLENEIKEDTWLVYNGSLAGILTIEPELLWKELLQRMGPYFRMVSNFPIDPSLN